MTMMTIGQLAECANVHVETIRYYQRTGLLPKPPKPESGYRKYSQEALEQLVFIKRSKELGFTLSDIKGLLSLRGQPDACSQMCAATERMLGDVRARIQDLQKLEATLARLLEDCSQDSDCQILKALQS